MGTRSVQRLGFLLADARRAGQPFDAAWSASLRAARVGSRDYTPVLATRESWRRAYCGEPPTPGERAAAELVGWLLDAGDDVGWTVSPPRNRPRAAENRPGAWPRRR